MADMETLELLVGAWELHANFPSVPDLPLRGSCTFEWMQGRRLLVQRSQTPDPAPDSLAVIAPDAETGAFRQHYFDTRGVVRLYAMTFDGDVWELTRTEPRRTTAARGSTTSTSPTAAPVAEAELSGGGADRRAGIEVAVVDVVEELDDGGEVVPAPGARSPGLDRPDGGLPQRDAHRVTPFSV